MALSDDSFRRLLREAFSDDEDANSLPLPLGLEALFAVPAPDCGTSAQRPAQEREDFRTSQAQRDSHKRMRARKKQNVGRR
jgi:hypothetical protein